MAAIPHGGALDRAIAVHGGRIEDWLDLSTGINPNAYPVPDLPADVWRRLPDEGLMQACLDAARAYYGVPDAADIAVAPGTQAIIQWLPILFNYIDRVTIVSPTYGEYERAFHAAGAGIETPGDLPEGAAVNPLLVIGQPNNPDGRVWPAERVARYMRGEGGARMVVADEAFADVAPQHSLVGLAGEPGLLVLRSFGKFFGLAGARVGFAIGDPDVIAALRQMVGPWATPGPALAIAARALADRAWIEAARARLAADSARLCDILQRAGLEIAGGGDLFVLAAHDKAQDIAENLARRHILVRSFDYDARWLRFGILAGDGQFARLQSALAESA